METRTFERCQEYCTGNIAVYYCPQCWTNYCEDCYDKEHKLKRRKEDHDKILTPRKVCSRHVLTLEYQNKTNNTFMCCMCVKEMHPGERAASNVEPIDGLASVMKTQLEQKISELEILSNDVRKKVEMCRVSINSAVADARNEVKRFFSALNMLLAKQEESFQDQLTNLLQATTSKPVLREIDETLLTAQELKRKGEALLAEDSLVVTSNFDGIASQIDTFLTDKKIKNFVTPTLRVSVNVHRHLLEMVRHPGYISSTFKDCCEDNESCKEKKKTSMNLLDPSEHHLSSDALSVKNDRRAEALNNQMPSIPICSPPPSLPDEDDSTPCSLTPAFSCNSSPLFFEGGENSVFRRLSANSVYGKTLSEVGQNVFSYSEDRSESGSVGLTPDEDRLETLNPPRKNSDSMEGRRKYTKRKRSQSSCPLLYSRKTRRNELSKELRHCDELLTELWASDDSFPFARPVDRKKVPGYYEVITRPMDLAKIKAKLDSVSYDSVYDFVDDMKLMFDNCYQFNAPKSEMYHTGVNLEKHFIVLLQQHFPLIYYESSEKTMASEHSFENEATAKETG